MPGFDGTGPMGQGPMTGGARGYCVMPGQGTAGMAVRGGFGRRGGGRGQRNWYYATGLAGRQRASMGMPAFGRVNAYMPAMTPEQETDALKNEADFLKRQLEDIQGRIDSLEKAQAEKK